MEQIMQEIGVIGSSWVFGIRGSMVDEGDGEGKTNVEGHEARSEERRVGKECPV